MIFEEITREKCRQMMYERNRPDTVIVSPDKHEELKKDYGRITDLPPPEFLDRVCGLDVVISDGVNGFEVYEKGGNK